MIDINDFFGWTSTIEEIGDPVLKADPDRPKSARREFDEIPVAKVVGLLTAGGKDFQGEDIDQTGIDWDYFRKSGWVNYEHQQGMENVIGYPDPDGIEEALDAEGNPATRVTVWILLDKRGQEIYDKMKMLQKAGNRRQFGFSIEGQALERDHTNPKRITKCRVKNVALTGHPVRDTARVEIVKGLAASLVGLDLASVNKPVAGVDDVDSGTPALQYKTADKDLRKILPDSPVGQSQKKTISYNDLCDLVRKSFPHIGEPDVRKVVDRIVQVAKEREKSHP